MANNPLGGNPAFSEAAAPVQVEHTEDDFLGGNESTRGRELFRRYKTLLAVITLFLRVVPRAVRGALWSCANAWHGILGTALRYCIAKSLAEALGECVYFGPYVFINGWQTLRIGSNVSIHRGCYIDASGGLVIGSDVSIAHQSSVLTTNHTWANIDLPIRDNPVVGGAVSIENDVWVGCGCRILAGARLRHRVVVAAGAVVRGEIGPGSLVGGVPARALRDLPYRP